MPRPRMPAEKARATGATLKNPSRYKPAAPSTHNHDLGPIGEPYEWLADNARAAWHELSDTLPWLNSSHRGIVGLTAGLMGRMRTGSLPDSGLNVLRLCLSSLGASPADAGKISWAPPSEAEDDPADKYFQ